MSLAGASLLIRADANAQMGTGHLMRCLALAQAWQARGGSAVFVTACDSEAVLDRLRDEGFQVVELEKHDGAQEDWKTVSRELAAHPESWVVLDGYHFNPFYQRRVKEAGHPLLVIDDTAHLDHYYADIVLNQNIHANQLDYSCEPDTRLLLGTDYVLLRREFWPWRGWEREIPDAGRKVLVTLGGADPDNQTLKVVRAVQQLDVDGLEAIVVVGASNPHHSELALATHDSPSEIRLARNVSNMPELMAWADVAVTGGGSTCWEMAFMGLPAIVLILAANQQEVAAGLERCGAASSLGSSSEITDAHLAHDLGGILYDSARRDAMSRAATRLVDGVGAERVAGALTSHDGETSLKVRPARWEDAHMVWEWANDPTVRANSFQPDPIPLDEHLEWFRDKLRSSDTRLWVIEHRGVPVAQIRYDKANDTEAMISLSVAHPYRGQGIGTRTLRLTAEKACAELGVTRVKGHVLESNKSSQRAFAKAAFRELGHEKVSGRVSRVFIRECHRGPDQLC